MVSALRPFFRAAAKLLLKGSHTRYSSSLCFTNFSPYMLSPATRLGVASCFWPSTLTQILIHRSLHYINRILKSNINEHAFMYINELCLELFPLSTVRSSVSLF